MLDWQVFRKIKSHNSFTDNGLCDFFLFEKVEILYKDPYGVGVSAFIFQKAAKKVHFTPLLFNDFIVEVFEGFHFSEIADLSILLVILIFLKKCFQTKVKKLLFSLKNHNFEKKIDNDSSRFA